ncbi:MAG: hypothetical protein EGQ26_01540 [Clostridiales bacterium]|nr:hypothetical protein [Clostridiales bacterium]
MLFYLYFPWNPVFSGKAHIAAAGKNRADTAPRKIHSAASPISANAISTIFQFHYSTGRVEKQEFLGKKRRLNVFEFMIRYCSPDPCNREIPSR